MDTTDPLATLVRAAREGHQDAWNAIVDRFLPLVGAIIRRHRLSEADGDDVSQTVWLRLVEHLDELREPDALPGWIRTTARNECLRVLRHQTRQVPTEADRMPIASVPAVDDARLLARERDAELWQAFATLTDRCQTLLRLLAVEPAPSYDEVGAVLDMAVGSIGPTRGRCLDTLRRAIETRRIRTTPPGSYG